MYDPEILLTALPYSKIQKSGIKPSKKLPHVGIIKEKYMGFSTQERVWGWQVQIWLEKSGVLEREKSCSICGGDKNLTFHSENYYDISRLPTMCNSCHSTLHKRHSKNPSWYRRLDEHNIPDDHWARNLPPADFNMAEYIGNKFEITDLYPVIHFLPDGIPKPMGFQKFQKLPNAKRALNDHAENNPIDPKPHRPHINYYECGLADGDVLRFYADDKIIATIASARRLKFEGRDYSLTNATKKAAEIKGASIKKRNNWYHEGVSLSDLYDRVYGGK